MDHVFDEILVGVLVAFCAGRLQVLRGHVRTRVGLGQDVMRPMTAGANGRLFSAQFRSLAVKTGEVAFSQIKVADRAFLNDLVQEAVVDFGNAMAAVAACATGGHLLTGGKCFAMYAGKEDFGNPFMTPAAGLRRVLRADLALWVRRGKDCVMAVAIYASGRQRQTLHEQRITMDIVMIRRSGIHPASIGRIMTG